MNGVSRQGVRRSVSWRDASVFRVVRRQRSKPFPAPRARKGLPYIGGRDARPTWEKGFIAKPSVTVTLAHKLDVKYNTAVFLSRLIAAFRRETVGGPYKRRSV